MKKGSIVVAVLQRSWSFEPRYKLSTLFYFTLPYHRSVCGLSTRILQYSC